MQSSSLCGLHIESNTMQPTWSRAKHCPIALSLERVGGGWSIMILRDAFRGKTRFDEFQKSLGIAPNIPSRRLRDLVQAGLQEKSRYREHPPRDACLLTQRGRDFPPVLLACLPGAAGISPPRARLPSAGTGPWNRFFALSWATPTSGTTHEHDRIGTRARGSCSPQSLHLEKDRRTERCDADRRRRGLVCL
jgi:DNA-binding HxlR family transcriptional regulator